VDARVLQISISKGGVPKTAIECASVGQLGIAGDEHARPEFHGGPRQALLLIASEVIETLQREGWPVFYGALGENITTVGIDHRSWRPGMRYRIGEVTIELTKHRQPCATLNPYGPGIQKRIYDGLVGAGDPTSLHWGECGFYAAVLEGGRIETNDIIKVIPVVN
jgi:MOSC domain-containing protein YiiM